jgi:hypothetical protein
LPRLLKGCFDAQIGGSAIQIDLVVIEALGEIEKWRANPGAPTATALATPPTRCGLAAFTTKCSIAARPRTA